MSKSRIDNSSEKFLMFTWQPAWILFEGDACPFTGVDNKGEITYEKAKKYFKFFLSQGAKLKHGRQWELLTVRALTGGNITLYTLDPLGGDVQALKPFGTVAANTEEIFNKILGAGEEIIVRSAGTPAGVMFLVREYESGRRGN